MTEVIKQKDIQFSKKNATFVFNLNFPLHDTDELKKFFQKTDKITITGEELIFRSIDMLGKPTCQNWKFQIHFDISSSSIVKFSMDKIFTNCKKADEGDQGMSFSSSNSVIFTEIAFFNFLSMVIHCIAVMIQVNLLKSFVKYYKLNQRKMKIYAILMRERKNFLSIVSLFSNQIRRNLS